MLNIFLGDMQNSIYNTSMYFNNVYLDSWLEDDLSKRIIKSVDKATVIGTRAIDSKILGVIPVTQLSSGTKTLLLIYHQPDKVFNASTCGDNCARWILEIAKRTNSDIAINLFHIMDFGEKNFEIRILNNNEVVHNMKELILTSGEYLHG